jgi:hypothetical protein
LFEVNENTAVVWLVSAAGVDASVTTGPEVSIVQLHVAELLTLPAASRASTANVCAPSASPLYVAGLVHDEKPPSSRLHWNPAVSESPEKPNVAELDAVTVGGFESMLGAEGGTVSTVHE